MVELISEVLFPKTIDAVAVIAERARPRHKRLNGLIGPIRELARQSHRSRSIVATFSTRDDAPSCKSTTLYDCTQQ